MGIINVTPDSFSGDGLLENTDRRSQDEVIHDAVTLALQWVNEGPVIIDVGGESTRPGASTLSLEQELGRVIPVIQALSSALPAEIIISIDTYKAEVARQALDAGASLVQVYTGMIYRGPFFARGIRPCAGRHCCHCGSPLALDPQTLSVRENPSERRLFP